MTRTDGDAFAPGTLLDHGEGSYSLVYSSFPPFDELLTRRRLPTGGCTWRNMVVYLLEENAPDALESLDFECDPRMFTAISDNLDALRAVAKMLGKLEHRTTVADIVENVDLAEYE